MPKLQSRWRSAQTIRAQERRAAGKFAAQWDAAIAAALEAQPVA